MDNSHQWSKFWWQDYLNDVELSSCSLAAQGLWMRMLCLMHRSGGYLLVAGKPPSDSELAALVGAHWRQVRTLLDELLRRQVCSKGAAGIIHSRRMIRAMEASEEGSRNARKRWGQPKTTNPPNGSPNGSANGENRKTPMLEAEAEAETDSTEGLRPSGSAAEKSPPTLTVVGDVRERLWREGKEALRRLTGQLDSGARKQIGAFLKAANQDCTAVLDAIRDCEAEGPHHPVSWIMAAIKGRVAPEPKFRNPYIGLLWEDSKNGGSHDEQGFLSIGTEDGNDGTETVAETAGHARRH